MYFYQRQSNCMHDACFVEGVYRCCMYKLAVRQRILQAIGDGITPRLFIMRRTIGTCFLGNSF